MMATDMEKTTPSPRDDEADVSDTASNNGRRGKRSELKSELDGKDGMKDGSKDKDGKNGNALSSSGALGGGRRGGKARIQVDREKNCPFLIRMFCKVGGHHNADEYSINKLPTADEVQLYTWKDATLKELVSLLSQSRPEVANVNARISFRAAYQDVTRGGVYHLKDIGAVNNYRRSIEDDKTLDEVSFVIGDFIDVGIYVIDPSVGGIAGNAGYGGGGGPIRGSGANARHNLMEGRRLGVGVGVGVGVDMGKGGKVGAFRFWKEGWWRSLGEGFTGRWKGWVRSDTW
ncbi:Sin3 associated polypeptide p18-domain-containing protein [Chytridium lagenaria]|nr:Sin3 associated polypeptide p18-domain-containing protein [Chytridium lagenaria]